MSIPVSQVITEIIAGDSLTLGEAAKLLPAHRGRGHATASSLWRWATQGAKAADGRLVKLETARFGGRNLTSRAAMARFAATLTSADTCPDPITKPTRSPGQRRKAAEAANTRLAGAGA